MIETLISDMEAAFCEGVFAEETIFRFGLEEKTITFVLDGQTCRVERGSVPGTVHCDCETSSQMLAKIWYDGYRPGIMDFLGGAVKCNNPLLLPRFLTAFGR